VIIIKNRKELEAMKAAGQVAAWVKEQVAREIRPGVSTLELDELARDLIQKQGAKSAFLNYRGYPGHTCISINEEVVHGIPGPRKIQIGDIVSLDVGVFFEGFVGDNATTVLVDVSDTRVVDLVNAAWDSLAAGIAKAVPGNKLGDVSHAIESVILARGFSVVKDFVGHGVGRSMHEDPQIPNYGPPNRGPVLRPGMTLAIEPMVNLGTEAVETLDDNWTVVTRDRKPSAHVEHTIAITENGPEILTTVQKC